MLKVKIKKFILKRFESLKINEIFKIKFIKINKKLLHSSYRKFKFKNKTFNNNKIFLLT